MATAARSDIFTWSGVDKTGRSTKGEIQAASQAMAKAQLRRQGIKTRSVRKKPKPLFGGKGKISSLMGDFGKGLKSFKKNIKDEGQVAGSEDVPAVDSNDAKAAIAEPAAAGKDQAANS